MIGQLSHCLQHRKQFDEHAAFPRTALACRGNGCLTCQDALPGAGVAVDHSPMRPEVQAFVTDGPLPDWDASEEEIDSRVHQLEAITRPVTSEEAKALATCFGPDDCYGVAWTLLHLIETAPGPVPSVAQPAPDASEWHHTLWMRWGNAEADEDNLTA
ncbi:hypothetical protein [Streptomyces ipomoeae]|uniref:hypothetical protein n=2 Tax=Streptomyces ipomoeae TaxID=103232 RepID=UPI00215C4E30|nr:hypothetical protein [Streptomyces ipomoeae]